MALFIEITE